LEGFNISKIDDRVDFPYKKKYGGNIFDDIRDFDKSVRLYWENTIESVGKFDAFVT